ncbi:ParB N-terminal domain-containing protein [Agrobacterium vitis]|uniref:methyltransferase domain-containing protein n=1 Tax=Agrobacterium vitis TaxID=373 RepID=UPI000871CF28
MIDLYPPQRFRHDPINPRKRDEDRFDLVTLSLRKFGFLLPLYARQDGLLLSGHQRSDAAARLGWSVPVHVVAKDIRDTAGLNLTFNRATNDFTLKDIRHDQMDAEALRDILEGLPDADDPYPCLNAQSVTVAPLLATNIDYFNRYACNAARQLSEHGIRMPIIIDEDGIVLNGVGRLQYASEREEKEIAAVIVSRKKGEAIRAVMNGLSMDFRLNDGFKDVLRTNAFRRARQRRKSLGSGYLFPISEGGKSRCKDFSIGSNADRLKATFGARVLDFGCGHGDEARMLRKIGIGVTTFEPFRSTGGVPSRKRGRYSASGFLRAVQDGHQFTSILLSSVLNSVPFDADRRHILTICAALCGPETTLFAAARSRHDPNWVETSQGIGLGKTAARSARFVLLDEPGMSVSELNANPKVQRYFQPSEFRDLFEDLFEEVSIGLHINNVTATCRVPRPLDLDRLRQALQFEFDLPYPEGRMGFADKALSIFSQRLGVSL